MGHRTPCLTHEQALAAVASIQATAAKGLPPMAPYRPPYQRPVAPRGPRAPVNPTQRELNLERMGKWVAGMRELAATKDEPQAFLTGWSDWLGRQMGRLGGDRCSPFYRGLTAIDLANAQAELMKTLEDA